MFLMVVVGRGSQKRIHGQIDRNQNRQVEFHQAEEWRISKGWPDRETVNGLSRVRCKLEEEGCMEMRLTLDC